MMLSVAHDFLPKQNSVAASQVMDHFGISFEQGRHIIAENVDLPIEPGQVVLLTGASGSGKSSLMRAVAAELRRAQAVHDENDAHGDPGRAEVTMPALDHPATPNPLGSPSPLLPLTSAATPHVLPGVLALDDLALPQSLLIDSLSLPAAEAMNLLSTCGLGEAHLMLRTPAELSDGQRYRYRLALALSQRPQWIVADEFTATLDRTLAKVIAYNIRRLADRAGVGFLLATTHEDVAADLHPDLHIRCRLDGDVQVQLRSKAESGRSAEEQAGRGTMDRSEVTIGTTDSITVRPPSTPAQHRKKKAAPSPSHPTSGSPQRPVATGRISLGGITAATTSDSSGK